MKFLSIALLVGLVAAQKGKGKGKESSGGEGGAPAAAPAARGKITENDVLNGQCKDITFIMARASTEPGNMGGSMGPLVCAGLKKEYTEARVSCQGVGPPYSAGLADNVMLKGTTEGAIREATRMFTTASSKCPKTIIVFGGYSQGTAVMHNAVSGLPAALKEKVVGGVLFGDTRNKQDKGQVPNYPKDKVTIFCDKGDGVCGGLLNVNAGHFVYPRDGTTAKAVSFLKGKIDPKLGGGGGGSK